MYAKTAAVVAAAAAAAATTTTTVKYSGKVSRHRRQTQHLHYLKQRCNLV